MPYKTLLAISLSWTSWVPPAPRLLIALNMPTEQKATKPTMDTWVHGELSARHSTLVKNAALLSTIVQRKAVSHVLELDARRMPGQGPVVIYLQRIPPTWRVARLTIVNW